MLAGKESVEPGAGTGGFGSFDAETADNGVFVGIVFAPSDQVKEKGRGGDPKVDLGQGDGVAVPSVLFVGVPGPELLFPVGDEDVD